MTEIEKQFFETFGIEPIPYCCYHDCKCPINDVGKFNSKCPKQAVTKECDARIIQKPQITDSILLELICILAKQGIYLEDMDGLFKMKTYETSMVMQNADNLKDVILKTAETACRLSKNDGFKHQVQAIVIERI